MHAQGAACSGSVSQALLVSISTLRLWEMLTAHACHFALEGKPHCCHKVSLVPHLQHPSSDSHLAQGPRWQAVGEVMAAIHLNCHMLAVNLVGKLQCRDRHTIGAGEPGQVMSASNGDDKHTNASINALCSLSMWNSVLTHLTTVCLPVNQQCVNCTTQ